MKTYKLIIEYDGSQFSGWQRQNDQTTIQGEIEKALSQILNHKIHIAGSGRTDAGVHAYGQVASFKAQTKVEPRAIKKGLTSMLKRAVVIRKCSIVNDNFHARYSAVSKEYHYFILNRPDPCAINRSYQWHIRQPLDLDMMNQCSQLIIGTHDFKSFESTGSPKSSTIRQLFFADFKKMNDDQIVFKIAATGFLKYMVRNIVGTIVSVGLNKMTIDEFMIVFKGKDRTKAGATAPAHGLFLKKVNYS
ncbi:MAG: tRNA pseudouridine(38-40) synthase TruA [Desulfobacula sp.]|nr:tRNA pseudouridine(38-40) synthase TruA [Desulfobacula sp.]